MRIVWQGEDGVYLLSVDFFDEKAGQAWMGLSVNDVLVDSWKGVKQYLMTTHKLPKAVTLKHGDQIRIDFYTQSKMRCRIDCMDINADPTGIGEIITEETINQNTNIYDMMGRRDVPETTCPFLSYPTLFTISNSEPKERPVVLFVAFISDV